MKNTIPKYLIKFWKRVDRSTKPPVPDFKACVSDEELIDFLRNIHTNYFVYTVGAEYESRAYFDRIFDQEKIDAEHQEYLKLKQKYEGDEKEKTTN